MMELFLISGQRIQIDPSRPDLIVMEQKADPRANPPQPAHVRLFIDQWVFPVALSYDAYKNAVIEYLQELEIEEIQGMTRQ